MENVQKNNFTHYYATLSETFKSFISSTCQFVLMGSVSVIALKKPICHI
jgi:hypothetical protein